jgi:lipopolysaccharide export system protein LptC
MNGLSTTSALRETDVHGFATGGRLGRERAFQRAMRHSRRVRLLRRAIPVAIVLIVGAIMLVSWLDPLRVLIRLPTDSGTLVISGTKITMEAPKLTGYTRDRRWYELTARSAAQDITKPNIVELHDVRAKIEGEDKSTMHLTAVEGSFDRKIGVLTLGRRITLKSTSGYELRLEQAVVDTGTGDIVSHKPVEVLTDQGTLNANGIEVVRAGEVVRFNGGVVLNVPGDKGVPGKPRSGKP